MTTEKICFRYDGSEEAIEALKWVNETFKKQYLGEHHHYYYNYLLSDNTAFDVKDKEEARLVPPAEFLRLVSEPDWKVGDECLFEDADELKHTILAINNRYVWLLPCYTQTPITVNINHIRPVRKSLTEEVCKLIAENKGPLETVADRILELVKERRDEL